MNTKNRKSSFVNHKSEQPKAYKDGHIEFYKLKFKVTEDVLIPRPETELLVDAVLEFLKKNPGSHKILDLGTGSGAIAISIAKNSDAKIIASDISPKALKIAKLNAKFHSVEEKITFIRSNLLAKVDTKPDIIVTNLPYIPTERIAYLDSSVKDFEPVIALDGGKDGFDLYRKLFAQIVKKGWKPKLIIGEIDYTQGELAVLEAQKYFPEATVEVKKDLAHMQRILKVKLE